MPNAHTHNDQIHDQSVGGSELHTKGQEEGKVERGMGGGGGGEEEEEEEEETDPEELTVEERCVCAHLSVSVYLSICWGGLVDAGMIDDR